MKKIKFRRPALSCRTIVGYLLLTAAIVAVNFALPQREPVSLALYYAACACGLNPFVCAAGSLLACVPLLSLEALLSSSISTAYFLLLFTLYHRCNRRMGWEKALLLLPAQLPFVFLYPHAGYAFLPLPILWQKTILAGLLYLLSLLFEGGLDALLHRALRCRLPAARVAEICLLWLFLGLGLIGAFGELPYLSLALFGTLVAVLLLKNSSSVLFGAVLSLPLCVTQGSALPAAEFLLCAALPLLVCGYGKFAAALSLLISFLAVQFFRGLYTQDVFTVLFTLLACFVPAVAAVCVPEKTYRRLNRTLLFYRRRSLPRIAINRNRRAVGEQLYEVSALFREIETAFDFGDPPDGSAQKLREKLVSSLCAGCRNRARCERGHAEESMDRLIAVGKAKGRVSLVDLPADLSSLCVNSAGLLFALNKHLADYRRYAAEMEAAREGRRLLAEQAHGVSEILKDIALEQSEEFVFSDEEQHLSNALAAAGLMSSEIFLYGEGDRLTVSMTLENNVDGKKLAAVAGRALKVPLALAERIPLTSDRACYILKKRARFDAAFGVASLPKEGEIASGDTHSILKIDERRFLVALSDGMGSGEGARTVSDHTLSLLESFYKTGMPSETVLGTVNRLIAFSAQETFSCLDLAAVNLDTGAADIVKIGSPAGFILSGEELRVLEGESLPIGMLEAIHPAILRAQMKENDFLVFMSDGVSTAFGSSADLCAYLSALRPLNPQSLAEEILKTALGKYRGKAEDDMTVLAVRLTAAA